MPRGRQLEHPDTPCAGVRSDFGKLLKLFSDSNSVRYEQFAEIWRELKMSFIFTGRDSEKELREFTEDILRIAAELWMPPANFQNRIGALYLLYGLYFKQFSEPRCKIRITLEMWQHVLLFMEEVKKQQHLDVEYCFHKLCYYRAFHYVANTSEKMPARECALLEEEKTKDELIKMKRAALAEQNSILSEILEPDSIEQLAAIHEQYHQMKCALSGNSASVPDHSLNIIDGNLVQNITKSVATFEDWRKRKALGQKVGRRRMDSGASGTSESDGESHSESEMYMPKKAARSPRQRRAEIRSRAYGSGAESTRRRHRRRITNLIPQEADVTRSTPKKESKSGKGYNVPQEGSFVMPEGVLVKTEEMDGAVLDMPLLASPEPTPTRKKGHRKNKSPALGKSKKGGVASPRKSPIKISLKKEDGEKSTK